MNGQLSRYRDHCRLIMSSTEARVLEQRDPCIMALIIGFLKQPKSDFERRNDWLWLMGRLIVMDPPRNRLRLPFAQ